MPRVYTSGNVDVAIDAQHIEFNYNYDSEELRNAILRLKQTVFNRRFSDAPAVAIREVNIVMKNEFVEFVVFFPSPFSLDH